MAEFNMKLTNNGSALLAKALNEKELRFKYISLGKGVFVGNAEEATQLTDKVIDLNISSKTRKDTVAILKAVLEYNAVPDGFTWTELGVIAVDPDTQEEILYMYGYSELGDLIPPSTSATQIEKVIQVATYVSNATNITATIDESLINIPKSDINKPDGVAGLNSSGVLDIRYGGTNASTEQQAIYNLGTGARQNFLINPDFKINQRGGVNYNGSVQAYTVDMWRIPTTASLTVHTNHISLTESNLRNDPSLTQPIERTLQTGVYTLSALCKTTRKVHDNVYLNVWLGYDWATPIHQQTQIKNEYTIITATVKVSRPSQAGTYWALTAMGNDLDILACKLERGETQSLAYKDKTGEWVLFEIPDYTSELLKCRRYLVMGMMQAPSLFYTYAFLNTLNTMRINPSIIGQPLTYRISDNALIEGTTILTHSIANNGVILYYTGSLENCYIFFPHGTGLSAEL